MPIPSHPLDIFHLILCHLSEALDYCERHAEGVRIALVSKSWRKSGLAIAWMGVKVDLNEDGPLLRFLAGHASVCAQVENFAVPVLLRDGLILAAAQAPFAKHISHLEVDVTDYDFDNFTHMMQQLAEFSRLSILRLCAIDPEAELMSTSSSLALERQLSLQDLEVALGGPETNPMVLSAISNGLMALVDPLSLKALRLNQRSDSEAILLWLPSCPCLTILKIDTLSVDITHKIIPALCAVLGKLRNLRSLVVIDSPSGDAIRPSPVSLPSLLQALPLSLPGRPPSSRAPVSI
ncbi:hypothetical protein JCM11641_007248 [Rhodosporidiobolus odoratus]